MSTGFTYTIKRIDFNEDYRPPESTRLTTNFANLARGVHRQENLRKALRMINSRCNALACWDNPKRDRYRIALEIISVDISLAGKRETFPSIEILKTNIIDRRENRQLDGIVGNNFSSYLRDYDFSILLKNHNKNRRQFTLPENFGELHGKLFKDFLTSQAYRENFCKPPVVCLSVSDKKTYHRNQNKHPVLGLEYVANETSLTQQYFEKMGFSARYFMPPNSVAPLAFFFFGDLLNDYTNLELIGTISTMETFQKIYRPEIYNANATAGIDYQPNLHHADHSVTQIVYDREERSQLAIKQGRFAEEYFINPHRQFLEQWAASNPL